MRLLALECRDVFVIVRPFPSEYKEERMHWRIITIGKPSLAYARAGVDEYAGRFRGFGTMEVQHLRASNEKEVITKTLAASEGFHRVLLDEGGKTYTSRALASWVGKSRDSGRTKMALIIGGADGHPAALREAADEALSLSPLTLMHELALVVALEQIYRAHCILSGHPYHRD